MQINELKSAVESAWEAREGLNAGTTGPVRTAVAATLDLLDAGTVRVAEKKDGVWTVNTWLKQAVLLSFRLNENVVMPGTGGTNWFDKVPSKFEGWGENRFRAAGFRAVPGSIVRRSAYIAPGVVLLPSFVNVGAYVDSGAMVDTWATVGSCAQIGKNVHLSGGVGIGGVLEPLQAGPVIIEDNCFIGARSEVVEGVIAGEGSPSQVVTKRGIKVVNDDGALMAAIEKVCAEQSETADKVRNGHVPAAGALIGAVMKETKGQADAARVRELLLKHLGQV